MPGAIFQDQEPQAGTVKHNDKGGFDMVYIPACEFTMGMSSRSPGVDEAHQVKLSGYWLSKAPVTVAQFRAYVNARHLPFDWHTYKPEWGWRDGDPMVNVTWKEAQGYCRWAGGRLPTEAEWEHAARGPDDDFLPWGDAWKPSNAWFQNVGGKAHGTADVGRTDHIFSNAFGLTDMIGNVQQWCFDLWDYDTDNGNPATDPKGRDTAYSGTPHVVRGSSWDDPNSDSDGTKIRGNDQFSSLYRRQLPEDNYGNYVGFRFACPAKDWK